MNILRIPPMKFNSDDYTNLDEQIKTMMKKIDHGWLCTMCGKTITNSNSKQNMMIHIEGVHMEDGAHPCSFCGKTYRSRPSLQKHIYQLHKHVVN